MVIIELQPVIIRQTTVIVHQPTYVIGSAPCMWPAAVPFYDSFTWWNTGWGGGGWDGEWGWGGGSAGGWGGGGIWWGDYSIASVSPMPLLSVSLLGGAIGISIGGGNWWGACRWCGGGGWGGGYGGGYGYGGNQWGGNQWGGNQWGGNQWGGNQWGRPDYDRWNHHDNNWGRAGYGGGWSVSDLTGVLGELQGSAGRLGQSADLSQDVTQTTGIPTSQTTRKPIQKQRPGERRWIDRGDDDHHHINTRPWTRPGAGWPSGGLGRPTPAIPTGAHPDGRDHEHQAGGLPGSTSTPGRPGTGPGGRPGPGPGGRPGGDGKPADKTENPPGKVDNPPVDGGKPVGESGGPGKVDTPTETKAPAPSNSKPSNEETGGPGKVDTPTETQAPAPSDSKPTNSGGRPGGRPGGKPDGENGTPGKVDTPTETQAPTPSDSKPSSEASSGPGQVDTPTEVQAPVPGNSKPSSEDRGINRDPGSVSNVNGGGEPANSQNVGKPELPGSVGEAEEKPIGECDRPIDDDGPRACRTALHAVVLLPNPKHTHIIHTVSNHLGSIT